MAATNETPNIHLPVFEQTDKPSWISDFNGAMNAIDTAYGKQEGNITAAYNAAGAAQTKADAVEASVTALTQMVDSHGAEIDATEARVDTLEQTVESLPSNFITPLSGQVRKFTMRGEQLIFDSNISTRIIGINVPGAINPIAFIDYYNIFNTPVYKSGSISGYMVCAIFGKPFNVQQSLSSQHTASFNGCGLASLGSYGNIGKVYMHYYTDLSYTVVIVVPMSEGVSGGFVMQPSIPNVVDTAGMTAQFSLPEWR